MAAVCQGGIANYGIHTTQRVEIEKKKKILHRPRSVAWKLTPSPVDALSWQG